MNILAFSNGKKVGKLFKAGEYEYVFEYLPSVDIGDSISISMPSSQVLYISKFYLHPFFDSFLPEGYLFEILKNIINKKEGKLDDFIMFYYLASGIEGRVRFKGKNIAISEAVALDDILKNDTWDTFRALLDMFLDKNAISGVQPKTIAVVKDKVSLELKEFIIKTFGDEYPNLTENEYFCIKAAQRAGIPVPKIYLSENKRFLVIEKFTYKDDKYIGFEEIGSILGRRRKDKYEGSYEQIARAIKKFSTNLYDDLETYYKMVVMVFLQKNGDAHNKNFGLLYSEDIQRRWLAPAYDLVCTAVYIKSDKPALFLNGTKDWLTRQQLEKFGVKCCALEKERAKELFDTCLEALLETVQEIKYYIKENKSFEETGKKIISEWENSLWTMKN